MQPLRAAVKVGGKIYSSLYTVHCNWDMEKGFNPSQTLFWRKEHNFQHQTVSQKLIYFILLKKNGA